MFKSVSERSKKQTAQETQWFTALLTLAIGSHCSPCRNVKLTLRVMQWSLYDEPIGCKQIRGAKWTLTECRQFPLFIFAMKCHIRLCGNDRWHVYAEVSFFSAHSRSTVHQHSGLTWRTSVVFHSKRGRCCNWCCQVFAINNPRLRRNKYEAGWFLYDTNEVPLEN